MDHGGGSSTGQFQAGSQSEPFFELLHPNTNASYNGSQNSQSGFDFGTDDVLPSFEFQPIVDTSSKMKVDEGHRGWQASPAPNFETNAPTYGSNVRNDKEVVESATVAAVERTMKKYADNLLRVLEGMSGRLSQLESNSQRMENIVSGIKGEAANNHGTTDGKLRALENMIREVQRGVQVLRDRQEIAEAHSQLAKLQLSTKPEPPPQAKEIIQEAVEPPPPRPPSAVNPSEELSATQVATPLLHHQPQQLQLQAHGHPLPSPPQLIPQPPQIVSQPLQQQVALHMALQQPTHPQHPQHPQLQVQVPPQPQISLPPQIISQPAQHQQLAPHPQQLQTQGPSAPPQMPSQIPQQQVPHQSMQVHQPPQQQQQQLQVQAPPVSQPEPQYQHQLPPPVPQQSSPALPQQLHMQPYYFQQQQQQQGPPPPPPLPTPPPPQYGNFSQELNSYGPQSHALQPQGSYSQDLPPPYLPVGYGNQSMPPTSPSPQLAQMPLQHQHQHQHQLQQKRPQQGPPNQQQLGSSGSQMYEAPRNSENQLALPPPYQSQGQNAPQMYDQYPPSQYRMAQPVTAPSSRSGYPQLPTAQPVQHAMPPAGGSTSSSSSGAPVSANRVPIEEVIDKVAVMGFSKDQVRGVVRRLTENGQSVDLNIVLDKLMNGGADVQQPPKGWFGR